MATINKNSEIYLFKGVKLDRDYVNVLYANEQTILQTLIQNHTYLHRNNYSFIRSTGTIATDFNYSEAIECNYIAYQNPDYSNKWFFAFLNDVTYRGDRSTELSFTIDSWSTWISKLELKQCFVEREHVKDDRIGANTIDEGIDTGEVIVDGLNRVQDFSQNYYIGVLTNYMPTGDSGAELSAFTAVNKQIYGSTLCLFPYNTSADLENLWAFIRATNRDGKLDDIDNIFAVPFVAINTDDLGEFTFNYNNASYKYYIVILEENFNKAITDDLTIPKPYTFSDYTPKNNKVFVYPYNYIYVTNNNGQNNILKIEDFSNSNNMEFETEFAITIGGSRKISS